MTKAPAIKVTLAQKALANQPPKKQATSARYKKHQPNKTLVPPSDANREPQVVAAWRKKVAHLACGAKKTFASLAKKAAPVVLAKTAHAMGTLLARITAVRDAKEKHIAHATKTIVAMWAFAAKSRTTERTLANPVRPKAKRAATASKIAIAPRLFFA